ncbi:MAG TPA: YciI family protein [Ktedonobacterales bacterium]|jgi:hypothetical protein
MSMRYMLLFVAEEAAWEALPDEERADAVARIGAWFGRWAGAGKIVEGRRLQGKRTAKTVRLGPAGRSGRPLVVDGPFIESKEAIGSYAIVEVAGPDEAMAIAESWPAGGAVEVRPLQED